MLVEYGELLAATHTSGAKKRPGKMQAGESLPPVLRGGGKMDYAPRVVAQILEKSPSHEKALFHMGRACILLKDLDKEEDELIQAFEWQ